ncbi:MAG: vWA domain-containing protein [Pseudomonadota bacterium]
MMTFTNPNALWLLLVLPPLLLGLGLWGWKAKREIAVVFQSDLERLRRNQKEKYVLVGVLMTLLIGTLALPEATFSALPDSESTGEIILLVDVSGSMAAQKALGYPSRLARVKPTLYEIVDSMEEVRQVKISLYGLTSVARSLVPFVGNEDYPYLRESIRRVLGINSIPGQGSSPGQSILDVLEKFSEGEQTRLILLFSDGDPFVDQNDRGASDDEGGLVEQAVRKATEEGVKVITVGVGEREGARIPILDADGAFTGDYAKLQGLDYISYLREDGLKRIASGTGGKYFFENDMRGLAEFTKGNLRSATAEESTIKAKAPRPIAHWFLLAALPVWVVFVRRHLLA